MISTNFRSLYNGRQKEVIYKYDLNFCPKLWLIKFCDMKGDIVGGKKKISVTFVVNYHTEFKRMWISRHFPGTTMTLFKWSTQIIQARIMFAMSLSDTGNNTFQTLKVAKNTNLIQVIRGGKKHVSVVYKKLVKSNSVSKSNAQCMYEDVQMIWLFAVQCKAPSLFQGFTAS